jgi:L,D-peptidoglycan transpeptidase YkuD (ErfK/YbiS/YcfS/YnhG family)
MVALAAVLTMLVSPAASASAPDVGSKPPSGIASVAVTGRGHPTVAGKPRTGLQLVPGTTISSADTHQLVVADHTGAGRGTWSRWQWRAQDGWTRVDTPATTTFGYGGVTPGERRIQGDGSTPAGRYPLTLAFGVADPGTEMPYRVITNCSWWIGDPSAADYNRWREDCTGTAADEHLIDYVLDRGLYRQAIAVGFNLAQVRSGPGSGSAIFVHYATGSTAGCVGVTSRDELTETIRWLDPAQNPTILILE